MDAEVVDFANWDDTTISIRYREEIESWWTSLFTHSEHHRDAGDEGYESLVRAHPDTNMPFFVVPRGSKRPVK